MTGAPTHYPAATAFFVSVNISDNKDTVYLVTARHVLERSRPYGELYLRLNTRGHGHAEVRVPHEDWVVHPSTDVAIMSPPLPDDADAKWIPFEWLATPETVSKRGVGAGDEVAFVGLFAPFPGSGRNRPVVRFGNISLMPEEKIPVEVSPGCKCLLHAYLVEARSWGGHSGSPAFVCFQPDRHPGHLVVGGDGPPMALLGLVSGHYEIPTYVTFLGDASPSAKVPVNAGMALVIPAEAIVEVLMGEPFLGQRERARALFTNPGSLGELT